MHQTLHDPMDCSLLGFSIHGIFQARILEWGAISFSKSSKLWCDPAHFSFQTLLFLICLWPQEHLPNTIFLWMPMNSPLLQTASASWEGCTTFLTYVILLLSYLVICPQCGHESGSLAVLCIPYLPTIISAFSHNTLFSPHPFTQHPKTEPTSFSHLCTFFVPAALFLWMPNILQIPVPLPC